jgi:hypothetical protein
MRVFRKRFQIDVPAKALVGAPPKRMETVEFKVPSSFTVLRDSGDPGATATEVNFGGLTETERKIEAIHNGIRLTWELKNEHTFPLSGRTAFLVLELRGQRVGTMSQSDKYRSIRKRFLDRFCFQDRVAASIESNVAGGKVTFGDQTIYLGQALLALSTEIPILVDSGQDTADARTRISELLTAIEELDTKANERLGGPATSQPDGLFVRDDIIGPGDPRLGGAFVEVKSDWQNPELENASPSGDQIFGLMFGLYGVVRHSGDATLVTRARNISSLLYDYARRSNFVLKLPNGQPTKRGSDMRWLASLLHGLNKAITGEDLFADSKIEVGGATYPLNGVSSFWDSPTTADKIASLAGLSVAVVAVPGIDEPLELNSFALHILLMALAPAEVWDQEQVEKVALKCNHHLSILLNCQVHNSLPNDFDQEGVQQILDMCPETGPRASLAAATGWLQDNRWVRCSKIFNENSGIEEYNGVDWLVLYNLNQMVFCSG